MYVLFKRVCFSIADGFSGVPAEVKPTPDCRASLLLWRQDNATPACHKGRIKGGSSVHIHVFICFIRLLFAILSTLSNGSAALYDLC